MYQAQGPQSKKTSTKQHIEDTPTLPEFELKEEISMRWFVLRFAAGLSLILIGADLAFAFINHNMLALIPSPLIATLWIPMVRHLFPGRPKISKETPR